MLDHEERELGKRSVTFYAKNTKISRFIDKLKKLFEYWKELNGNGKGVDENQMPDDTTTNLTWEDIFVVTDNPKHTYNPRNALDLEKKMHDIFTEGKLGVIVGPTKTGKSVLVKRILSKEPIIWIHGGEIEDQESFWEHILCRLELFTSTTEGTSSEASHTASTSTGVTLDSPSAPFVPKVGASAKVEATTGTTDVSKKSQARQLSPKTTVLAHFSEHKIPLVIDDFHFINKESRKSIVKALKGSVGGGFPVILITVPSRKEKVYELIREMIGRIVTIEIPHWTEEELSYIPKVGFRMRGYSISNWQIEALTSRCLGNPLLMQDMCLHLARNHFNQDAPVRGASLPIETKHVRDTCNVMANNLGQDIYHELTKMQANYTKPLNQAARSRLGKVHTATLSSIARMNKFVPHLIDIMTIKELHKKVSLLHPTLAITEAELRDVAVMLSDISSSEHTSVPVVHYKKSKDAIEITDPMFAFFLNTSFHEE